MLKNKKIVSRIKELANKNKSSINKNKKQNKIPKKISYKDLTINQIESELKREKYKSKYIKVLKSTIYALIIIAALAALIATLIMPVLQISGDSMTPAYNSGEIVLTVKTNNLKSGDVIAFYHGNKILVKRIIAKEGNWVNITEDGKVYINGQLLDEPYVKELSLGEYNIEFPYQVPAQQLFVLSDNRSNNIDSRNTDIGCVKQEDIIGKILLRIWPLK